MNNIRLIKKIKAIEVASKKNNYLLNIEKNYISKEICEILNISREELNNILNSESYKAFTFTFLPGRLQLLNTFYSVYAAKYYRGILYLAYITSNSILHVGRVNGDRGKQFTILNSTTIDSELYLATLIAEGYSIVEGKGTYWELYMGKYHIYNDGYEYITSNMKGLNLNLLEPPYYISKLKRNKSVFDKPRKYISISDNRKPISDEDKNKILSGSITDCIIVPRMLNKGLYIDKNKVAVIYKGNLITYNYKDLPDITKDKSNDCSGYSINRKDIYGINFPITYYLY